MEESSSKAVAHYLPKVLVSAATLTDAELFLKDLIDNQVKRDDGVYEWKLVNKYYTTSVQVIINPDGSEGSESDQNLSTQVEAHVIYFTEKESADNEAMVPQIAAQRAANGMSNQAEVKLVVCDTEEIPSTLDKWARAEHYEAVPLRERASTPDSDPGPFPESYGVERVRKALHAHMWPGVNLVNKIIDTMDENSSDSDWDGVFDPDAEEEQAVENAELFSAALSALGDHRSRQTDDADRLNKAEALVAAFCRALGHNIDRF